MAKADFEKAKEQFPSTQIGTPEWKKFFDSSEGFAAMGKMIGDIYDEVLAQEEREAGIRSLGRRPGRKAVSLDDVFNKVFGRPYSMDAFPTALGELLQGRSQRQFAAKIPCNQSTLSRLASGATAPDMLMMERIALAAKVPPFYFKEWRAQYLSRLVEDVLLQKPHLGITAYRQIHKRKAQSA